MAFTEELTCRKLWGFDCNLILHKSDNYMCLEEDHHEPDKAKIVSHASALEFDLFLVGDVLNGLKKLDPSHELIKFLSSVKEGRRYAVSSVNVPAYSIDQVSMISSSYRLTEIATSPNTPEETLEYLSTSHSLSVRLAVARNPYTPSKTLSRMYKEGPFELFLALADNVACPTYVLLDLARKHRGSVGKQLAQNPSITEEIATLLLKAEDSYTRIFLASFNNISLTLKKELAVDDDWRVRYALGRSANLEEEVIDILMQDEKDAVRSAIACNQSTPCEKLKILSDEEPYVIRYRLVQNQNLPLDLFAKLSNDRFEPVRRVAASNPYSPFFYDDADMEHLLAAEPEYAWVSLLSSNEAPEIIKSKIREIAHTQKNVRISEFGLPDRRNIFLLADLIADGRIATDLESMYNVIYHLCQYPKDSDRIEEFAFFVLQEHEYSQEVRLKVRSIIISNMRESGTRLQAILRHTAGV
jgi:hypothetical protein